MFFENKKDFALNLIQKGILFKPEKCPLCGNRKISINKYSRGKTTNICFKCMSYKCKKTISIRYKSFFDYFNKIPIEDCMEVIKCFIIFNFNVKKAHNYLTGEKQIKISDLQIRNIYTKLREIIYYYYLLEYEIEDFALENQNHHFSLDESLFCHDINGKQIWVLGMTENETKNFRLICSYTRDNEILKKFIYKFIPPGNHIISDGWNGYSFLDEPGSGYRHSIHIHGRNDFGIGLDSTSHIESIWGNLKQEIKRVYITIRSNNFLYFLRESEFKYKYNKLKDYEKLEKFFEIYSLLIESEVEFDLLKSDIFLNNDDLNNYFGDEDENI